MSQQYHTDRWVRKGRRLRAWVTGACLQLASGLLRVAEALMRGSAT